MTIADRIRRAREAKGLSQGQLGEMLRTGQSTVAGWESGAHGPGRARMVPLAQALGVGLEWLVDGRGPGPGDSPPSTAEPIPANVRQGPTDGLHGGRDLPVYASAQGGPDGMILSYDAIEYVLRPAPLMNVPGAFAMYVVGDSMSPRYEPGELLLVHPTKPPARGDDVLIVKHADGAEHSALVKRFLRWQGDVLEVQQLNPLKDIRIPRREIKGLHLVVGRYRGR